MGRRPNALTQEFFDRGAKLDNNSNRYQYSCKRCGEFFPKGRLDALTGHLLRRCPDLSQPDRTWVLAQCQYDLQKPAKRARKSHDETLDDVTPTESGAYQSELPPPFLQQQQSALDTLAEVSRHHSSRADANTNSRPSQGMTSTVAEAIAEQALMTQLQDHCGTGGSNAPVSTAMEDVFAYPAASPPDRRVPQHAPERATITRMPSASPLVRTASAANEHLEQAHGDQHFSHSEQGSDGDARFQSFNIPIEMGLHSSEPNLAAANISWGQPVSMHNAPTFGSFSMPQNDTMSGFGVLASSTRQKPRGRFDDSRRKEVSEIRKQGACLRCRMLKKPCSGETPCKTCATVESARIWKGKCLRTRLADELPLWSMKVFQARAEKEIAVGPGVLENEALPGRIEMRIPACSGSVLFNAKAFRPVGTISGMDPALASRSSEETSDVCRLDEDDRIADKIGANSRQVVGKILETHETPPLVKSVLQQIHTLAEAAETRQTAGDQSGGPEQTSLRLSYGARNGLTRDVQELWTLTRLLTSEQSLSFRSAAATDARSSPEKAEAAAFSTDSSSYRILRAQLLAAAESRCSVLSKSILNELERRLVQRQQTSRFATLLSATILLSSVEHMVAHYASLRSASDATKGLETGNNDNNTDAERAVADPDSLKNDYPPASWPIDTKPSSLITQAETFADLLNSLLRMRGLPPKTRITPDGVLESVRDSVMPAQANGQTAKTPLQEQKEAAADWLNSLNLEAGPLKAKRDAAVPGAADGKGAWELRFVGNLLLPEE